MDLFKELIPNILMSREPILEDEKDYNAFVINMSLAQHLDTILYSNEMNLNSHIDRQLQHDYFFNSVRKYKRPFYPWMKKGTNEELAAVKEYYQYSSRKAQEALNILTKQQVKEIVAIIKSKDCGVKK
jgi:hypothetical protein